MRTLEQITKIKQSIESPYSIKNFISEQEITHLINLYDTIDDCPDGYELKIKKNTGPVTLNIKILLNDKVLSSVIERLKVIIGDFEITAGLFFKTDYPHIIHNDDTFELPDTVYKAITIPLKAYGDNVLKYPDLCFFDQFYFQGPAKFFKNESHIDTFYNKQVYDYSEIDGIVDFPFDNNLYLKHFTHLKPQWLDGLSYHSSLEWKPGNALIFDSTRLHCASDFRKLGIKSKLGISIFTKK
jgi:hypothetical protein